MEHIMLSLYDACPPTPTPPYAVPAQKYILEIFLQWKRMYPQRCGSCFLHSGSARLICRNNVLRHFVLLYILYFWWRIESQRCVHFCITICYLHLKKWYCWSMT